MKLGDILRKDATAYGRYVLENRAFSEICDGLKPAQRALLWSAKYLGMDKSKARVRSARLSSTATGNYHPHGDNIYQVLCNIMPENIQYSYFEADSAFGDRMSKPGAARYSESSLSEYGKSFLNSEYLDCVPYKISYDGLDKVPLYLPSLLPNILINGTVGIGYGASADIPPFTIESIRPIIKAAILGKPYDPSRLEFNLMYNPIVQNLIPDYFQTGKGSLLLSPRRIVNPEKTKYTLTHTFVLNRKNRKKIFDKITSDPSVVRMHDMSKGAHTLEIEIILKGTLADKTKCIERIDRVFTTKKNLMTNWIEAPEGNKIYEDDSDFEITFQRDGFKFLIDGWVAYRLDIEQRRLTNLIAKTQAGLDYQKLLLHALLNSDKVFAVLDRKNKYSSRHELDARMAEVLTVTHEEAHEITDLAAHRLSSLEKSILDNKILKLKSEISDLNGKLNNLGSHTAELVDAGLEALLTAVPNRFKTDAGAKPPRN